jgi:(S)-ureidoglycine aminohydrolase
VVKPGIYTVIPPEGRVLNVLPHFEGFSTTILASPKYGASFVFYVSSAAPEAKTVKTWCKDEGVESFVYFMDEENPGEGKLTVRIGDEEKVLSQGGYAYAPAGVGMDLLNASRSAARILLYKQRYLPLFGYEARVVWGNVNDIQERIYDDMENVFIQDLLPMDLGFDMNFHILSFEPAGSHPFIETHVQEHGAYILSGQGVYMLDEDYVQVQKEDFIWFGPFAKQAVYATGRERLSYIYSKDFNRDVEL